MERQSANVNLRNNLSARLAGKESIGSEHAVVESSAGDNKFIVKIFDKIIGLSMFMLFFGVPLYFTGLTSQGIIFEKQLYFYFWLLLGLVVWAAKGVTTGEMKIKRTPLDWPILGFWLVYLAATIFSVDRWHSFWGAFADPSRGLMSITAYIIAYYFIFSNFNGKRLRTVFSAIIISGIILSIWTTLAVFAIKFLPDSLAAYSPLSLVGSVSGLGMVFSALVPLFVIAILKLTENVNLGKRQKNILLVGLLGFLALDLFLILSLYNYVPWPGFFIGVGALLVFILAKIVRPNPSWVWLPMVVFVLVMILRMIGAVSFARVELPVEVSLNYKTSAQVAGESLKEKLLVGSGPATYGYDFSLNRPADFNLNAFYNLRFSQGTGLLAEAVPTIGVAGIIFFFILILTYVGSQIYLLYKDKEKNKLYSLGFFSAAIILLIDALSLRVDGAILVLTVLLVTLSLAAAFMESETKENSLNLSLKASPKFALALAFVFMVVSAGVAFLFVYLGKVYAADIYSSKAAATFNVDQEKAISYLGKAITYNNREAKYYIQTGQYYMAMANQEANKSEESRSTEKISAYLNNSITAARISKDMLKNDVAAVESLALVYENASLFVSDSLSLAEENYKRAQELEPHNPVYYVKLGQIKIGMAGSKESTDEKKQLVTEAKDLFQKAIEEKNNYADGYYQLALVHEALENLDEAIDNGTKAASLVPKNANYFLALGRMYEQRKKGDDIKIAEQYYKAVISLNDKDINGHFYLGLFYENNNKKEDAKNEYTKVVGILESNTDEQDIKNNKETLKQLKKMIENVNNGIKNTPQSLGLVKEAVANQETESAPIAESANVENPTINETQPVVGPQIEEPQN